MRGDMVAVSNGSTMATVPYTQGWSTKNLSPLSLMTIKGLISLPAPDVVGSKIVGSPSVHRLSSRISVMGSYALVANSAVILAVSSALPPPRPTTSVYGFAFTALAASSMPSTFGSGRISVNMSVSRPACSSSACSFCATPSLFMDGVAISRTGPVSTSVFATCPTFSELPNPSRRCPCGLHPWNVMIISCCNFCGSCFVSISMFKTCLSLYPCSKRNITLRFLFIFWNFHVPQYGLSQAASKFSG